jgi:hypothetical protein
MPSNSSRDGSHSFRIRRASSSTALWRLLLTQPEFTELREFPWPRSKFTSQFATALFDAAEKAAAAQINAAGDIDQPLGELYRIAFGDTNEPLGGATIHANDGTARAARVVPDYDSTLRAFESRPAGNGQLFAYRGSQGMRLVVFGRQPQSWSLRAFGQQMEAGALHAADQVPLISRRQFKPMLLERAELLQHIESTITLDMASPSRQ